MAAEWDIDAADMKKWRFTRRKGVKFHGGSSFDADAVILNLDKVSSGSTFACARRSTSRSIATAGLMNDLAKAAKVQVDPSVRN